MNRKLVERLRSSPSSETDGAPPVELTDREREVLTLLVQGCDNGEIAARLFLSPSTVKNHVSAVLQKLGVENRVQAAVRAVLTGLVEP
jgi:DNA-binding NarL/FixJ family response regulator